MTPRGSDAAADICVCRTDFDGDTTTLCFPVSDDEAGSAQECAARLGVDPGQLLRDALAWYVATLETTER